MASSKQRHVRIVCPHCGKNVSLVPPRTPLGFVRPVACPNCHIPIQPAHIKAQTEPLPEPEAERPEEEAATDETSGGKSASDEAEDEDGKAAAG
jgi:ssDNA-binding Zn-finger/Zn-ribbon topoisomerase 1